MAHPYFHGAMQSPQRGTLYPGQAILVNRHNVQVERYLSQGGFAHVYVVRSAVPINNNTQHVLKRIAVSDQSMLKEVQKEVEVMRKLRGHPNVVDFIDASWHALPHGGYEVFILMEFCAGGGLIDMMNRRLRERLTETEILQIFVDVCEAVAVMHSQNPPLLHRDLKIENILQASSALYKLCDFGSAASVFARHPSSLQELRELEADLGRHTTLQYRAPEMVDVYQRRHIDQKSDIWALGVLLYKLCYYTTPFEEHGPLAILNVQYRIPPYPVYSREMNALIASMLQELGTQRPTVFELLKTIHQLRGTKSKFTYVAAQQTSTPLALYSIIPSKNDLQDVITSRPVAKHSTNVTAAASENMTPMRRGRPVSATPNAGVTPSKNGAILNESKNPWLSAKPAATQDRYDDAWSVSGSSQKTQIEEHIVTGFAESFSGGLPNNKVISKPNPSLQPQPVSQSAPQKSVKSSRDAFDGLAGIPRTQAPPTLGEAAQSIKSGLRVPDKPPLRGVISRSPLPQGTQLGRTPISPRMSASRTGLAAYRSPSLSVEQKYPSLEDLDRSWSSPDPASRPPVASSVMQPVLSGKITLISKLGNSSTPRDAFESAMTAENTHRDEATFPLPTPTTQSHAFVNAAVKLSPRPTTNAQDRKDVPIGSSPVRYRPAKPALARKRLSFQAHAEGLPSIPSAPKDWLTGDTSPINNATMLPPEEISAHTLIDSLEPSPSPNVLAESPTSQTFIKPYSLAKLKLASPNLPAGTTPSSNYAVSKPADESSSDEAEGPEEIATTPLDKSFSRSERRKSSVHDLVDLYGGRSRLRESSKIPSPSKQTRRTSGTLIDISIPSSSLSDFLSPSIVPKSQAELVSRHFCSRSNSPVETKLSPTTNISNKLSPKSSPISGEWKDKRPQSMLLLAKPKPDPPALLQPPVKESHPKRAGRRSSISDMVNLYESLVINSSSKIPPPIAQKPPALKGKTPPVESQLPIPPTSTSFPSKLLDSPQQTRSGIVKSNPRRSSTFDYFGDKLNIPKEGSGLLQPDHRLSTSPVSPILRSSNNMTPSVNPLQNSTFRRSPTPLEPNQEDTNDGISSPTPERPYQGVSQLISQWQRKSEEAEESRRNFIRGRGRPPPIQGRSIGQVGHKD